jgi:hypothetical protein
MFDRIRHLARRPVRELPAGLVLAVCATVLAAGAILIASTSDNPPRESDRAQRSGEPPTPAGPEEITLYDEPDKDEPSHEITLYDEPDTAQTAPPAQSDQQGGEYPPLKASDATPIRQSARGFLRGYLPYSYAQAEASEITDATPELVAELERDQPRPPHDVDRRRPRVVLVHLDDGGLTEPAEVVALIDDSTTRYTLRVRLTRTGPRAWAATNVGDH